MKQKCVEKEQAYIKEYNDLMNDNLIKEFHKTKSPHLVFNHKYGINNSKPMSLC